MKVIRTGDGQYDVTSETTAGVHYTVRCTPTTSRFSCTCPAAQHRAQQGPCKHVLQVGIWRYDHADRSYYGSPEPAQWTLEQVRDAVTKAYDFVAGYSYLTSYERSSKAILADLLTHLPPATCPTCGQPLKEGAHV